MSGFGALLEARPASANRPPVPLGLSLRAAALADRLNRHSQAIGALHEPLARRVAVLNQLLTVVTRLRISAVPLVRGALRAEPAVQP